MGVVDEGSISGVLPSTKLFAVHYPGYPSSITRAVETLGGTDGIVKVWSRNAFSISSFEMQLRSFCFNHKLNLRRVSFVNLL